MRNDEKLRRMESKKKNRNAVGNDEGREKRTKQKITDWKMRDYLSVQTKEKDANTEIQMKNKIETEGDPRGRGRRGGRAGEGKKMR